MCFSKTDIGSYVKHYSSDTVPASYVVTVFQYTCMLLSLTFALSIDGVDAVAFFTLRTGVDASAAHLTFDAVADGALCD